MDRAELIKKVIEKGVDEKHAEAAVDLILKKIKAGLVDADSISLEGFGVLSDSVEKRPAVKVSTAYVPVKKTK